MHFPPVEDITVLITAARELFLHGKQPSLPVVIPKLEDTTTISSSSSNVMTSDGHLNWSSEIRKCVKDLYTTLENCEINEEQHEEVLFILCSFYH